MLPNRPGPSNDDAVSISAEHDALWTEWASSRNEGFLEDSKKVVKIASGDSFVLALRASGEVWMAPLREGQAPVAWEYVRTSKTLLTL